jgi:DNA-binding NarL/FixJ family response regulator
LRNDGPNQRDPVGEALMSEENRVQPLTDYCRHPYASFEAAVEAGAMGWVLKTSLPNELLPAVHRVLDGGKYL